MRWLERIFGKSTEETSPTLESVRNMFVRFLAILEDNAQAAAALAAHVAREVPTVPPAIEGA